MKKSSKETILQKDQVQDLSDTQDDDELQINNEEDDEEWEEDYDEEDLEEEGFKLSQGVRNTLVLIATFIAIGASLFWLQWSAQQGYAVAYPQPTVKITTSIPSPLVGETSTFTAEGQGRNLVYSWEIITFDEQGQQVSTKFDGQTISYTFNNAGMYAIIVQAKDPKGQTVQDMLQYQLTAPSTEGQTGGQ